MPNNWIERELSDPAIRLEFEIERLCQEIALILSDGIESIGLTRKDVARKLDVSEAVISRALNGLQNVTLKTAASIAFAADARIVARLVSICDEGKETDIEWTVLTGGERGEFDIEGEVLAA